MWRLKLAPFMEPAFQPTDSSPPDERPMTIHDIAARLRIAIGAGELQPQERLVEESIARSFGTNRAFVRGALALLEEERLVVRERNRGVRVRAVTPAEATEILEVRAVLEGLIARRAAAAIDATRIGVLRALLARMHALSDADDLRGYLQCNAQFHRAIAEIGRHAAASRLLDLMESQSRRFQFRSVVYRGRLAASLREHALIVDALERRDGDAAEAAIRQHVLAVADTVGKIGNLERPL
jgi:DNA-binding GntR family transcriptional regulator